jgi:hypothetical protein
MSWGENVSPGFVICVVVCLRVFVCQHDNSLWKIVELMAIDQG